MSNDLKTIGIKKFKSLFPENMDAELGDDVFIADFYLNDNQPLINYPFKPEGYVALFCVEGCLSIDINLNTYILEKNTLIINIPGNILRISNKTSHSAHVYVVAMSEDFFSSTAVDFTHLFNESMTLLSNPCITLSKKHVDILTHYIYIGGSVAKMEIRNKNAIVGSLISSVSYFLSSIWIEHLNKIDKDNRINSTRNQMIFNQFLNLALKYHTKEHSVGFYAENLMLTPKYLSKIIKTVSGKSAPEWIDSYIILEAKNLLKYSDCSIKEIVYKLNFPSQSVFYKFFKRHTGKTPSEYRKS